MIECRYHFSCQVMIVKWRCCSIYRQTKSCLMIKAGFIIREPASTREQLYIRKTVGDEVATSGIGKKRHRQYKSSAKERANMGKYFTEVFLLPYLICHLGTTRTLKQP